MKLPLPILCICALLGCALCLSASAENEAWYFPDGTLYVPFVHMQNNQGDTVTNYAAFFKKSSAAWNFRLYGLAGVTASTNLIRTNYVTSTITNYVTISNFIDTYWHGRITTTDDGTNVTVSTNFVLSTNFHATTNITTTTNIVVVTNVPSPTPADVAGTWNFMLNEAYARTFTGTEFGRTTNASPVTTNLTLTLVQTGSDVVGSGTVSSVQYSLTGEVTNDFFVFTMLAGTTNKAINLFSGHALVGDGELIGDYFWSTTNAAKVGVGDFYAEKQATDTTGSSSSSSSSGYSSGTMR